MGEITQITDSSLGKRGNTENIRAVCGWKLVDIRKDGEQGGEHEPVGHYS